jgi:large subunit ribosomal protein L29
VKVIMSKEASKVKELNDKEIAAKIKELRADLMQLRLKKSMGQLDKSHLIRQARRGVARLETELSVRSANSK